MLIKLKTHDWLCSLAFMLITEPNQKYFSPVDLSELPASQFQTFSSERMVLRKSEAESV